MRLDRRQFIQLSATSAFMTAGCCKCPTTGTAPTTPELQVDFEGLYIIDVKGSNTKVYLVDGGKVGYTTHNGLLTVLASAVDAGTTSADHNIGVGKAKQLVWELQGLTFSMPEADNGSDNLTPDPPSAEDNLDTPKTEAGWHSLRRVLDLHQLCGATAVNNTSAITSTISLKDGNLDVLMPDYVGSHSVWKFEAGAKVLDKASFSNIVRYTRSNNGKQLVINLGAGKTIVLKQGVTANISISNNPPNSTPCGNCTPNMDHFKALVQMVDAKITPTVSLDQWTPPGGPSGVEPDYCPGGRI
jgi:hypothetical protein